MEEGSQLHTFQLTLEEKTICKDKVKIVPVLLTKHHAMKTSWGMEV
jgi:hypothetical protein